MINISEEMARVIWRILEEVEGYGDLDESFLARFVEDDGYDYEVTGEDALEFFRELVDSQKRRKR